MSNIKTFSDKLKIFLYFSPLVLLLAYYFIKSLTFNLHDFSNSYFSARLLQDGFVPQAILFDIYEFNNYIWNLGYKEVLVDFYLNSPFTLIAFYPLSFIKDAYLAKAIFNLFNILLFVISLVYLTKRKLNNNFWPMLIFPLIFFVPIRNQILFGQSYFLIFFLIIFAFLSFEAKNDKTGGLLLSVAVLLKVFPLFYGLPLVIEKKWKTIGFTFLLTVILVTMSIFIMGFSLWKTYMMEIIPNAIRNNSTVDFRSNAQSIDVFLKSVFIKDSYYNPSAIFNNERIYILLKWIVKSFILGIAIHLSIVNKNNLFKGLCIWIVALFLLQSRTATYAQILWIIPSYYVLKEKIHISKKVLFFSTLFVICNLPLHILDNLPILLKFSRLWFTIIAAVIFYNTLSFTINYKAILAIFVILLPVHLNVFKAADSNNSEYILDKKEHFTIYDYFEDNGNLFIKVIGKNGNQTLNTNIVLNSFDETNCEIIENQILFKNRIISNDHSLKKKPVLVNKNEIYYLTDLRSRRGAYTLKKIKVKE